MPASRRRPPAPSANAPDAPPFDVAVIGGGINGTGIAREAAYRGYRTVLLEKDDFAQATSSQSTKMIHGGVRYLETGDFHLVRESLLERWTLLQIAPHLVRPLDIIIPAYARAKRPLWMLRIGIWLYNLLAGRRNLRHSRRLSAREAAAIPGLRREGLRGAVAYTDGQVFDARLCLETALSAAEAGATVLNYHPVEGVELRDGAYHLRGTDRRTGAPFHYTASAVVNATGPWTPFFERATLGHPTKQMVYDRGVHLVIPSLGLAHGLALPLADGRLLFALPWQDEFTLVGTTETDFEGEDFTAIPHSEAEVDYLLDAVNSFFPERRLSREHVLYIYSGVRTLIAGHGTKLTKLSREAEIALFRDAPGTAWLVVYGGKLTSYRALAAHTVKKLASALPPPSNVRLRFTDRTPLFGGNEVMELAEAARPAFLSDAQQAAWQARYGSNWVEVLELAAQRPPLRTAIVPRRHFTHADLEYMVDVERAVTVEDLCFRRTKMIYTLQAEERGALHQALRAALRARGWNAALSGAKS